MNIAIIIRTFVYMWILFEAIFLALLYKMAWATMRRSKVIFSLHLVFLTLAVFFTLLFILPIMKSANHDTYDTLITTIPIPGLLLALALRNFREKSLEQDLPNKVAKIGTKKHGKI